MIIRFRTKGKGRVNRRVVAGRNREVKENYIFWEGEATNCKSKGT